MLYSLYFSHFFFFNDTATTEIYTLSLHDALPISDLIVHRALISAHRWGPDPRADGLSEQDVERLDETGELISNAERRSMMAEDRKSTRLNSSHANISYAVFCLKKKKYNHE